MRTTLIALLALLVVVPTSALAGVEGKTWSGVKGLYRGTDLDSTAEKTEAQPPSGNPPATDGMQSGGSILPDPPGAVMDEIMTLSAEEAGKLVASVLRAIDVSTKGKERHPRIAAWWLTNQRILDRAYRDINRDVGVQCKPWVRNVVRDAVGVYIPPTANGSIGWYWNYSPDVVSWCGRVEYASPGQILQMWLGAWKPHTAIIVGMSPSGMYWIDSNWDTRYRPNHVLLHWLSYSYFYSRTGGYFTINQINR